MNPDQKIISFEDTAVAFSSKNNGQLKQSKWLFKFFGNDTLVKIFSKLTLFAFKIKLPISSIVKKTIFKQFCAGETLEESDKVIRKLNESKIGSILDYSVEGKETLEDFEQTKNEVIKIIHLAKKNPSIPYTSLKITGIAPFEILEKLNGSATLTEKDNEEIKTIEERINSICYSAFVSKVPIYFDAEESWIQNTIDALAEKMMRKYNKEKAIILTTLQMYRWDRIEYLQNLILAARKENFKIGIKLVRGAYMERENKRAFEQNYRSPIQTTKEETDKDFDKALTICLENIDIITLCAGTHNESSTQYLIDEMNRLILAPSHPNIYFSQLYGMSDNISYNLANAGYNVTKYLPYGPVKSVIPYLIRRAEENSGISGQMGRELSYISNELERRKELKLLK
ncbi:MAG: proline dehydrogenase family protein [Bacteroidetes bacterium]|nr:proline dehydrogenase family protein [Bacteroidota bacterium]